MVSPLIYLFVGIETALALALPQQPSRRDVFNDGKAIKDAGTDVKNGDVRKGWDKLPRWAQITIIVVAVVVVLLIIGIISCCIGCARCLTCDCCTCCCTRRSPKEVHHHHNQAPPRNSYLPMNDMGKFEPAYEQPQYAAYAPGRR